jgi:hypothetical protein
LSRAQVQVAGALVDRRPQTKNQKTKQHNTQKWRYFNATTLSRLGNKKTQQRLARDARSKTSLLSLDSLKFKFVCYKSRGEEGGDAGWGCLF